MKKIKLAKSNSSFEVLQKWSRTFEEKLPFPTKKTRIETSFGFTNVLKSGPDEGIPIVIFHGAMAGAAFAMGELRDVPKKRNIYAINIPGQSTEVEQIRLEFGTGEYAKWISEVFKALEIDKACVVGISWGGSVALELAKDAPELIESLLLVVPGSIVKSPLVGGILKIAIPMLRYKLFPSEKNRDRAFKNILTSTDPYWSPYLGDAHNHYNIDFSVPPIVSKESLKNFDKPVFVIAADEDISFPGEELLAKAKELFPNFQGGHLLNNSKHCPSFKEEDRKNFESIFETGLKIINQTKS